jgi:hypothetical protein
MRSVDVQFLKSPVIKFTPNLELERAERMSDAFETIADRVGIVIERVDAPLVTNVGVRMELNSVNDWVSHCCISMLTINLCPQR